MVAIAACAKWQGVLFCFLCPITRTRADLSAMLERSKSTPTHFARSSLFSVCVSSIKSHLERCRDPPASAFLGTSGSLSTLTYSSVTDLGVRRECTCFLAFRLFCVSTVDHVRPVDHVMPLPKRARSMHLSQSHSYVKHGERPAPRHQVWRL